MRLEDALIALGENYASYVLESVGSKFTVDTLPNTFEEFKEAKGLEDPLWDYIVGLIVSKPSVLHPGPNSKPKREFFPSYIRSDKRELLSQTIRQIIKDETISLNEKLFVLGIHPDSPENLLRSDRGGHKKCIICGVNSIKGGSEDGGIISGFTFSTYDKTNRKEHSPSFLCFKHFMFLLLGGEDFIQLKGNQKYISEDKRKKKSLYFTFITKDPVATFNLRLNLSFFLKDYYLRRGIDPLSIFRNMYFIFIYQKPSSSNSNETIDILGLFPLLFLESLSVRVLRSKKYAQIVDSLWNTLFDREFLEERGSVGFSEFGSLFVRGFLSDQLLFEINSFQRYLLGEEKENISKYKLRKIGDWYVLVDLFTEEVIPMGDKTVSPQHLGFQLGREIVRSFTREKGEKAVSQVRKLVRSYSHMMEVSEGEFLKKLNDLLRRIDVVPFNTSCIPVIAKSRRYRLLFVNGLLAGAGSGSTKQNEENTSTSFEQPYESTQEVMVNE